MRLGADVYVGGAIRAAKYTRVTIGHRSVMWERYSHVYIPHRCMGIRPNSSSSLLSSSQATPSPPGKYLRYLVGADLASAQQVMSPGEQLCCTWLAPCALEAATVLGHHAPLRQPLCLSANCHDFRHFPNISLPKSQAPTLIHSTHDMFSLSTRSLPYLLPHLFILSSYSVIRISRTSQVYSDYSETRILRSAEGVLPTGKSLALQIPPCTCG